ncbi:MAG: hypothetical protein DRH33_01435 [Candidatus Nealsonbacteria bacterium]|nr:MAG: hypothetical protein DRH33_01435 [Candidatus Nealsonbacteria bacterium]
MWVRFPPGPFMDSKKLGRFGEKIAREYLKRTKYKILARNFKRKWGEIDIVAKKGEKIVFIEVKTIRKKEGFFPEDEIDQKKKKQLIKIAQIYLEESKIPLETPWQIDIIAIEISPNLKKAKIRHYKNAVEDIY